ncbi:MAG: hypothetical protein AAB966_03930, partial [Patescibacteria group bacterium]
DFLRYSDGTELTHISQDQAEKMCPALGARLPTIREIVGLAKQKGILTIDYKEGGSDPKGYSYVNAMGPNKRPDTFYINTKNYVDSDHSFQQIWSSTLDITYSQFGYIFDSHSGAVYQDQTVARLYAARCFTDQSLTVLKVANTKNGQIDNRKLSQKDVGDFIRLPDGKIRGYLGRDDAYSECKRRTSKIYSIPSIKQLAVEATKYGASVIEVSDFENGYLPSGFEKKFYELILGVSDDGSEEKFYYSYQNYLAPKNEESNYWVYSSSVRADALPSSEEKRRGNFLIRQLEYFFVGGVGAISLDSLGIADRGEKFSAAKCLE